MGIPKKSLYVIDTGDENCLLLSAFKPQRNKYGEWGYTLDTPLGLDMWILKTSFPDYIPGDCIEVKVDISQEETGLYVANDPTEACGGVRIYNTRPILKEIGKYKYFSQEESETYESWNIHICCDHEKEILDYTYKNAKLMRI